MGEHARIKPSDAYKWGECPGSLILQEYFPDLEEDTEDSEEGNRAHQLAYDTLMSGAAEVTEGDDDEMNEAVQLYVDHVRSFGIPVYPEYRVQCPDIHPTLCWGTIDAKGYDESRKVLRLWDFKYGHGYVEEVRNKQLITYVSGLISEMGFTGIETQEINVVMTIVQPRCYGHESIRTWSCKASDLRADINKLRHSAEQALLPDPPCRAGKHCEHCSGRHECSTLNNAALSVMDYTESLSILDIKPELIGKYFDELKRIESILKSKITGMEGQLKHLLSNGKRVDGWAVKSVPGNLKWTKSNDEIVMAMGAKVIKLGLITPTQAKKVVDESVINQYSERPSSIKLVKDDNKKASKVFGNQQKGELP